jgi:hypothetical protein
MAVIIGRATIPDLEELHINGANDVFLISGAARKSGEKDLVRENLGLIHKGSREKCSFTTEEGIPVRYEELKINELSFHEHSHGNQQNSDESALSFRIVLLSNGVETDSPAELLL